MTENMVAFLRKKDYELKERLGNGACGETVLLYEETMDQYFVCKKYAPISERDKEQLFEKFLQEIKLLHLISHQNIVRVFNYYVYPERLAGYILMEYVKGTDIETYLRSRPEDINEIFSQTIEGFAYLESSGILHRDIRPQNIMITDGGAVKIIDFGFGKQIFDTNDFGKSITLNWLYEPPLDFKSKRYDFKTEIYFVGKLFEKIIEEGGIEHFSRPELLDRMCALDPNARIESFNEIKNSLLGDKFESLEFSDLDLIDYREFSSSLFQAIAGIDQTTKYSEDFDAIQKKLEGIYKSVMLEEYVPKTAIVINCFLNGGYKFHTKRQISVVTLQGFIELLRRCPKEKQNIVLSNLFTKLDALTRYDKNAPDDDDIPF